MSGFALRLEACDPSKGRFRAYRVEAWPDLFGVWLVDVTYGRTGARGRQIRYTAQSEEEARRLVRSCLSRRASAPRRIGVAYEIRELAGDPSWLPGRPPRRESPG